MTPANSSSISDGAAALVLMRASEAKRRKLAPLARSRRRRHRAGPPGSPRRRSPPSSRLLEKVGWSASEVDLYEINEAFAVVAMRAMSDLALPHEKVNVHGGACALGHPIGASGARILVTLLAAMEKHGETRGVARSASAAARRRRWRSSGRREAHPHRGRRRRSAARYGPSSTAIGRWPEWNPFAKVQGRLAVGERWRSRSRRRSQRP